MRTRTEAARYVEGLLDGEVKLLVNKQAWHFGRCEVRQLFDFIWEGEPHEHTECLGCEQLRNNTAAKNKRFDDG